MKKIIKFIALALMVFTFVMEKSTIAEYRDGQSKNTSNSNFQVNMKLPEFKKNMNENELQNYIKPFVDKAMADFHANGDKVPEAPKLSGPVQKMVDGMMAKFKETSLSRFIDDFKSGKTTPTIIMPSKSSSFNNEATPLISGKSSKKSFSPPHASDPIEQVVIDGSNIPKEIEFSGPSKKRQNVKYK